jgi:hypothetical protein
VKSQRQAHVVEIDTNGLTWRKSSASGAGTANCVEVAAVIGHVLVRCSRDRGGPGLSHSTQAWSALLGWLAVTA